ncbi:MAG: phage morphogenesis protein [Flavobacteriaceae bacterium]|nr:MAG: phage morphogenesis protein [Flavobacteriaceae bacterium]
MNSKLSNDFKKRAEKFLKFLTEDYPIIIEKEGLKHFKGSFKKQGFEDTNIDKWEPRKTTDKKGRDLTRYRTKRVGEIDSLTKFGKKNADRDILQGHNKGGNRLSNSLTSSHTKKEVTFQTLKSYAKTHNEGLGNMPKRQFMGPSKSLDKIINKKTTEQLNKIFKK